MLNRQILKYKFLFLFFIIVFSFLILTGDVLARSERRNERITLTTYYPAPFGVYRMLQVKQLIVEPKNEVPEKPVEGMIFFANDEMEDSEGNTLVKGLWLYIDERWQPLVVSFKLDQPKNEVMDFEAMGADQLLKLLFPDSRNK